MSSFCASRLEVKRLQVQVAALGGILPDFGAVSVLATTDRQGFGTIPGQGMMAGQPLVCHDIGQRRNGIDQIGALEPL